MRRGLHQVHQSSLEVVRLPRAGPPGQHYGLRLLAGHGSLVDSLHLLEEETVGQAVILQPRDLPEWDPPPLLPPHGVDGEQAVLPRPGLVLAILKPLPELSDDLALIEFRQREEVLLSQVVVWAGLQ